jgi:hypothetical protein
VTGVPVQDIVVTMAAIGAGALILRRFVATVGPGRSRAGCGSCQPANTGDVHPLVVHRPTRTPDSSTRS